MKRPKRGMTEMRRDGKDDAAVGRVIKAEFEKRQKQGWSQFNALKSVLKIVTKMN